MKQFSVYYKTDPTFHEDRHLAAVIERDGTIPGSYTYLLDIPAENLEGVFHTMQGHVWSPNGEARNFISSLGLHHTSMSVGDLAVEVETGQVWEVAFCGFNAVGEIQGAEFPEEEAVLNSLRDPDSVGAFEADHLEAMIDQLFHS